MIIATHAAKCLGCGLVSLHLPALICPECGSFRLHYLAGRSRAGFDVWRNSDEPFCEYWSLIHFPLVVRPYGSCDLIVSTQLPTSGEVHA